MGRIAALILCLLLWSGPALAQTTCTGECTVTVVLTPAEIDQARVDDLNAMFGLFISAIVVVYFGRQLLKIFDKDPYES